MSFVREQVFVSGWLNDHKHLREHKQQLILLCFLKCHVFLTPRVTIINPTFGQIKSLTWQWHQID